MRIILLQFVLIALNFHLSFGANYYWVGNGGNWSDYANHWATSSGGGTFHTSAPTTGDNVFFDANSFASGSQTVTINANASCANIDFTGVSNTPTITGTSSFTLTCAGSLTFVAGITYTFAGNVSFTGTGVHTITSAGKTFSGSVLFNGTGGQWTLQDAFVVTSQLGLQAGTLSSNNQNISCGTLNANIVDNTRTLDLSGSAVTITGTGTSCDLRGNTTNLTISSVSTCTITFTGTAATTVQVGNKAKTIPNLYFPNCSATINLTSGTVASTTERITYRNISTPTAGGYLYIDNQSVATNQKTIGSIYTTKYLFLSGANGTSFGAADVLIVTGDVTAPNLDIYGHYAEVQGNFTQTATNNGTDFRYKVRILGNITVTGAGNAYIDAWDDIQVNGNINVNVSTGSTNGVTDNFYFNTRKSAVFAGTVTTSANTITRFPNSSGATYTTFSGAIVTGAGSKLTIGSLYSCTLTINSLTCGTNSITTLIPGVAGNRSNITSLILNPMSLVEFGSQGTLVHTIGSISFSGNCTGWTTLRAYNKLFDADISFSSPQSVTNAVCEKLNVTSSNLTNTSGVDNGGNTGITFVTPTAGTTWYWVGGLAANTKTGTSSTGNNNNWSNPDNWATASGVYSGTNTCIPGPQDNVVFDANSFTSATNKTCEVDLYFIYCNDMTWSGVTAGCYFDQTATNFRRTLYVFGSLTFAGANMTNNFEGTVSFESNTAETITTNGSQFYGGIYFDNSNGSWSLADNVNINGGTRADVTVNTGTLIANATTINLEGDFSSNTSGIFTPGTSTIIFDATSAANTTYQYVTLGAGQSFYNFTVNRTNGTGAGCFVLMSSAITISNNLSILIGNLWDNTYQITGNATGVLSQASGTRLRLGNSTTATLFPTNYVYANITLDPASYVTYYANANQTVSGLPDYGYLEIVCSGGTAIKTKTLTEAVLINTKLFIDDYANFIDNGYQISFDASGTNVVEMDANSKLTLGTAITATTFPPNYTAASLDFDHTGNGCTVVYNGGVAQTIQGFSGTAPANYSHLQLSQPGAGSVTKTLNANTVIRGNLTIDANNVMDVSGSNYSVTIGGSWSNSGTFNEQNGSVTFNGSTVQNIDAGGNTETYYNLTFNNTNATGISYTDDIVVTNTVTFTDGFVTPAAAEIFYISDNATATAASSASYVDGKVRKTGDDSFIFPVGDDSYYAPIEISAPSVNTDHFTAQYINTDPNGSYSAYSREASLHHISRCEY